MKDIFYISSVKAIKTISSERRLKILRLLVDKEYSAKDLSKILKVKTNVLCYDVQQLEDSGLITLMRSEQIRGTVKRYYRSVARNFVVDSSLGQANIDHSKKIQNLIDQEIADWRREKIVKIDFQDLSHKIINHYLEVKENEVIAISYQPMHQKLVEDLMIEIARVGAYPIPIFWTKRIEYNFIKYVPLKYACKDVIDDFLMDKIDAQIIFSGEFLEGDEEDTLTPEMIEKNNQIEKSKRENIRKTYQTNVRFLTIDTLQKSQTEKLYPEICTDMYWKSLNVDVAELQKECEFVRKRLQNARKIEIQDEKGNGLKITLPEQKRTESKNGIANTKSSDSELPGGVIVCLLENADVEGEFNTDFAYLFADKFENVSIKTKNGRLIETDNSEIQKRFMKAKGNKDVIGSLCIGINPEIQKNIGHPYINSKIYGSASLQVGWDELQASEIDSDMMAQFFMLNKTIKIDGKILFKNGKLYK